MDYMLNKTIRVPLEGLELMGEPHPLIEQLGSVDGLVTLNDAAAMLKRKPITSRTALMSFLELYLDKVLFPLEMPAVYRGYYHVTRNQTRELIKVDEEIARLPLFEDFAEASRKVGQTHLKQLKPLKDERLIQRYLQAVEAGQAHGWHTLVYGLTLATYSIPVRQGLVNYARQTLGGFVYSVSWPLRLHEKGCLEVVEALSVNIRPRVETLLASRKVPGFAVVN